MTSSEWTKEYIEHRDRAAESYSNWRNGPYSFERSVEHNRSTEGFKRGFNEGAAYERERAKVLLAALNKIKEMSYQVANSQYGDRSKADRWGCVVTANEALAKYGEK